MTELPGALCQAAQTPGFNAVNGGAGSDVFAVGSLAPYCASTAATGFSMTSGNTTWLNGVWGSSGSDVFLPWVILAQFCTMTEPPGAK